MTPASTAATASVDVRGSWIPMIAISLGQAIMSFNVAALPVSMSGMVASFGVPPTTVATGIAMYSLAVAGLISFGFNNLNRRGLGLAALTIIPAGRLPNYRPGEIPANPPPPSADEEKRLAREAEVDGARA